MRRYHNVARKSVRQGGDSVCTRWVESLESRQLLTGVDLPTSATPLEPLTKLVVGAVERVFTADENGAIVSDRYQPDLFSFTLERPRSLNLRLEGLAGSPQMSYRAVLYQDDGDGVIEYDGSDVAGVTQNVGDGESVDREVSLGAGTYFLLFDPAAGAGPRPGGGDHTNGISYRFQFTSTVIGGVVFEDENRNGVRDAGEGRLEGRRVYLDENGDGKFQTSERSTLTDANGAYLFADLAAGAYAVRVVNGALDVTAPATGVHAIDLAPGQNVGDADFGLAERPATPEITVTVDDNLVADGQAQAIDFGSAPAGSAGKTITFEVHNVGVGTLALGEVQLPAGFALVQGLRGSLSAGESDTFVVRMLADDEGTLTGQLSFTTNDPDENPFNFNLTGTVAGSGAPARPAAPTGLKASATSSSAVRLTWTDEAGTEKGYRVYRKVGKGNGPFVLVKTLGANATGFDDAKLKASTVHVYRVTAFNDAGESGAATVAVTTKASGSGGGGGGGSGEPGNSASQARNLGKISGRKAFNDRVSNADKDFLKFQMTGNGDVKVQLTGLSGDADVYLYLVKPDGKLQRVGKSENSDASDETIRKAVKKGTYVLRINAGDTNVNTNYALSILTDFDGEGTRSPRNLKNLTKNRDVRDFVGTDDLQDYMKLTLTAAKRLTVGVEGFTTDVDVKLYDKGGKQLAVSEKEGLAAESLSKSLKPGTYYVHVYRFADAGETDYTVKFRLG